MSNNPGKRAIRSVPISVRGAKPPKRLLASPAIPLSGCGWSVETGSVGKSIANPKSLICAKVCDTVHDKALQLREAGMWKGKTP